MTTSNLPPLLPRPRLLERLDRPWSRLTVLAAPSGYGKTSLVRSWVETITTKAVTWVTLEDDMDSSTAFWQAVLTSAGRLGVVRTASLDALTEEVRTSQDPVPLLATGLTADGPTVLVLDGYERLRDATARVDVDLARLVDLAPQLSVVVTTRTAGGLASPGRSLRDEVTLLTEHDLAFTEAETHDLLTAFTTPEIAASAAVVQRTTHGYPLGLRAMMLSLGRHPAGAPLENLEWHALVAEDLRAQLAGPAHDFVLATCIPPYFDAELAAELAGGGTEVKAILTDLEWNGFGRWIPFAPGRQVFQYVDALREAMLAEASQLPARKQVRAAELSAWWLHRHGRRETALAIAVRARLYGVAARIYAVLAASDPAAISSPRYDRHLATVPSLALTQFPALAFGRGLACHRDPSLRGAAAEYFKIPAAWDGPRFDDLSPGEVLLGHVSKVVSLRLLGRFDDSGRAARQGLDFFNSIPHLDVESLADLRPMALRHLAYSQHQSGDIDGARGTIMRAVAMTPAPESRNQTAVYAVGLNAFDGRLAEARSAATLVDDRAWRPGQENSYANALGRIGRAVLQLDDFHLDGAAATYDDCPAFRDTAEFWPLITWTLMHARLGLGQSAAEALRVEAALHRAPSPPGMADSLGATAVRGTLAVLWLAAGNRTKAAPLLRIRTRHGGQLAPAALLSRLLAGESGRALDALPGLEGRRGHTPRSLAAVLCLGAAAALRAGNEPAAIALVERVLAHVGPDGARMHLMYLPAEDLAALRHLAAARGHDEAMAYLSGSVPSCFSGDAATAALTAQERAVIVAMARHRGRAAVAASLHVSENTVKTHLQRIYRKWGVNSRDAVIQRAIELDLLTPS
ncbi:helix-turn-helix transcriptional regulator [Nocardioides alcanivorans]|uniref:helix-turn-helix transcriptional regulator n=1 Tax=Nocardioides alcanivorans TaxID=2897352 RepID=UPI001F389290|nr:LuxR C-terminal-related transcriptional regulator [Nocardioides alcanivorans]